MLDFKEIASKVGILDAARFCELSLNGFRAACPYCNQGGERALQFFTDSEKFKCWPSNVWGDSIQLVAHIRGVKQSEAAALLASRFNLADKKPEPQKENKKGFDVDKYREGLNYEHELLAQIGLPADTAKSLGVGVAPKGSHQGKLVVPLYTVSGEFYCYASVADLKLPKMR